MFRLQSHPRAEQALDRKMAFVVHHVADDYVFRPNWRLFCVLMYSVYFTKQMYNINYIKGKVFPLQARCGPEGG